MNRRGGNARAVREREHHELERKRRPFLDKDGHNGKGEREKDNRWSVKRERRKKKEKKTLPKIFTIVFFSFFFFFNNNNENDRAGLFFFFVTISLSFYSSRE